MVREVGPIGNQSPTVSVVIRTYTEDRWDYLEKALESLRHQSITPHEVVVVVDNNNALLARVRDRFSWSTPVGNPGERGSAGAWNAGVAACSGEIMAFIDDDAVADPQWLEALVRPYADPSVVGVGGSIMPMWVSGRPSWFPDEFHWVVGCTYRGLPEKLAQVRNLIGCNMSFRADVFRENGGFRGEIGHVGKAPLGCDETELCIRVRQRWPDSKLMHEPRAIVHHHVPASRCTPRYFALRCYYEGRSKAIVASFVGAQDGLSSERDYTLKILPSGVIRGFLYTIRRGDLSGLLRAAMITVGLGVTGFSYLKSIVASRLQTMSSISRSQRGADAHSRTSVPQIRKAASTTDHEVFSAKALR